MEESRAEKAVRLAELIAKKLDASDIIERYRNEDETLGSMRKLITNILLEHL